MLQLPISIGRVLQIMAATVLAAALSACGGMPQADAGPARASEPAGTLDTCALLASVDVAATLGVATQPPEHTGVESAGDATTAAVSTCRFAAQDTASSIRASIMVRRAPSDENGPSTIRSVRDVVAELAQHEPEEIAGLGDTAFWGANQLHVFSGGRLYLIVSINGLDDALARVKAEQLARAVLAQL